MKYFPILSLAVSWEDGRQIAARGSVKSSEVHRVVKVATYHTKKDATGLRLQ